MTEALNSVQTATNRQRRIILKYPSSALTAPTSTTGQTTSGPTHTHWWGVAALFMAGLVASMHFAKLAPIMSDVAQALGLSLVQSAWAVSSLGVVGVVFAIAAGAIIAAWGLRRSLLAALFGGALLAALVAVVPQAGVFLSLRVLEGFSHLVIVVAAPALMARQATERDRPLAMALWGCFFGLGFAITSALAPPVVAAWGWRGLLSGHALLMALVGVLVWHALRAQPDAATHQRPTRPNWRSLGYSHIHTYRSGTPLLLALCFCAYAALFLAMLTFLGRFWVEALGASSAHASQFMALLALVTLAFTLLAGWLVRWGMQLRSGLVSAFVLVGLSTLGLWVAQPGLLASQVLAVALMAGFGLIPGFVFANIPRVAPTPERATLAYGAIAQFGNVGTFSGTPLVAWSYEHMGWSGAAAYVCAVAVVGVVLALVLHARLKASMDASRY
jgi:predicted MFS family arabinose efflux permease